MKSNRAATTAVLVVLFCTLMVFYIGGSIVLGQDRTVHFASYDELTKAGLIDSGTVPHYLPDVVSHIRVAEQSDTGVVELEFTHPGGLQASLDEACSPVVRQDSTLFYLCGSPYRTLVILHADGRGELTTSASRIALAKQVLKM